MQGDDEEAPRGKPPTRSGLAPHALSGTYHGNRLKDRAPTMVAPDSYDSLLTRLRHTATTVRLGVSARAEPSQLPLHGLRDWAIADSFGLAVEIDVFAGDAMGFADLQSGRFDVIAAPPMTLLEAAAPDAEPLACFFAAPGGLLARADRLVKLRNGEPVLVSTARPGQAMDRLCRRIVQGWAGAHGFAVAETQITLAAGAEDPVEDLGRGFDAAWPVTVCDEGVRVGTRRLETVFLTADDAGVPGFAALELVAISQGGAAPTAAHHAPLLAAIEAAIRRLQAEPARAAALWRAVSGTEADAEEIVAAALPYFQLPLDRRPGRWRRLADLLRDQ